MSKILAVMGPENSGKTTFAVRAMLSIIEKGSNGAYGVYHDTELGIERAFRMFDWKTDEDALTAGVKIYRYKRPMQTAVKISNTEEVWQQYIRQYNTALEDKNCLVQAVGTATELWTINHSGWLQVLQEGQEELWQKQGWKPRAEPPNSERYRQQIIQIEYGPINKRMSAMLYASKQFNTHLILEHHETDEYIRVGEDSKTTGRKILDGFRYTPDIVDLAIKMSTTIQTVKGEDGKMKRIIVPQCEWQKAPLSLLLDPPMTNPSWDVLMALAG